MKKVVSLMLALVMVFAMMPHALAASDSSETLTACGPVGFTDTDQITNAEAVAVTTAIGLFSGTPDGRFDPAGTVTRAQMAAIIVKMLKGCDFDADIYKGEGNPFTDTAGFQGGWAEGYINACVQMHIVNGYGDGTFRPGNAVTVPEAATMLLNALKVEPVQGTDWPASVIYKARAMNLFGELDSFFVLNWTMELNRDQLSVIINAAIQYKPEGGETLLSSVFGVKNINTEHKYGEGFCEVCHAVKPGQEGAETSEPDDPADYYPGTKIRTFTAITGIECKRIDDGKRYCYSVPDLDIPARSNPSSNKYCKAYMDYMSSLNCAAISIGGSEPYVAAAEGSLKLWAAPFDGEVYIEITRGAI